MKRSRIALILLIASVIIMTAGPLASLVVGADLYTLFGSIAIGCVLLTFGVAAAMKDIEIDIREDEIEINGPMIDEIIPYDAISGIEFRAEFKYGLRWCGYGGISRIGGGYYNNEFRDYKVAGYVSNKSFVIIHHSGGVTAFNVRSWEETRRLYEKLMKVSEYASRNAGK